MSERVVVVNAGKMNYDHALDFSILSNDVQVYEDSTNAELIERIQGARVVVTKELPVSADLLSQFPDTVELIVEAGTGYNNIDLDAAKKKGITVCNIPAYSTERVAHTVIMMILNFASTMQQQIGMLAKGNRSNFTKYLQVSHTEVNGKTLGVVGAGHIGMEVIKVAKALGMNILVHTRTPKADGDGIRYVSLDELLENSDYISLHCPLNDQTKHLINKKTIGKMKPNAVIVNTGRGPLINERDLCEALAAKRIAGAGLDVQEVEPPAEDSPLYTLDNVIITPHMGWKGLETRQRLVGIIRDNVQAFFKGEPINVVS
ncbi:2-hydroxyacid dehydrogenase [uncultured Veillonella sp.]|jgi:D-isomer specific 2-hydroxyacid dehydrogenase NAD-binding protein|uniref:2-hydroxyacid dehydrogenase n=1 Tax=uncultured Veillonella sp. TaxID=159268 RepID=UPI00258AB561|nr:NAD(P)-dependent oxidoreductase [uncultured Veillonella sp.]